MNVSKLIRVRPRRAVVLLCLLGAPGLAGAQGVFPGNDNSYSPSVSANGCRLAFLSLASNLVPGDTNGSEDIFVLDRCTAPQQLVRVSVNDFGAQADGQSWGPSISPDGRYVAFVSNATNLVAGDTNGTGDVFRKDLGNASGTINPMGPVVRVSLSSSGAQGTETVAGAAPLYPSISNGGNFVSFFACLNGLVPSVGCAVFLRDIGGGQTFAVDTGGSRSAVAQRSTTGFPSSTTVTVVFQSSDALVPQDTNATTDVYLRRYTYSFPCLFPCSPSVAAPELLSAVRDVSGNVTAAGNSSSGGDAESQYGPVISADGLRIAFNSDASNLTTFSGPSGAVAADTNGEVDTFVYFPGNPATQRLSRETDGLAPVAPTFVEGPGISADGRWLVYHDRTPPPGQFDRWVLRDIDANTETVIGRGFSTGSRLEILGRPAVSNAVTGGGTDPVVAWPTAGFDLPGVRLDRREDVFVSTGSGAARVVTMASAGRVATALDGHSRVASISGDGGTVVFSSYASGFGGGDQGANRDVFLRSLASGAVTRVSAIFNDPFIDARWPTVSRNGQRVAFLGSAGGPLCAEFSQAFVVRLDTSPASVVCLDLDAPAAGITNLNAFRFHQPVISQDGNWVAFAGTASGDPANQIYLRSVTDPASIVRATRDPANGGAPFNPGASGFEHQTFGLSGNGQFLVYTAGSNLSAPSEGCYLTNAFLYDRVAGSTQLISRIGGGASGTPAAGSWASISADGRWVALVSCDNLANETNPPAGPKVYLWNRTAITRPVGQFVLIIRPAATFTRVPFESVGQRGVTIKARTRLSDDGRYLAYIADDQCVFRCSSRNREIVLYDRVQNSIRTVSLTPSWGRANGPSGNADDLGFDTLLYSLDLSGDGRKLVFSSSATNLVPGDRNAADDVFVLDVPAQTLALASAFGAARAGDLDRLAPALNATGTMLAFARKDRDGAIASAGGGAGAAAKGTSEKWSDVAVNSVATGQETVVSQGPGGAPANGDSGEPDIAPDASVVAFSSDASNLGSAPDTNGATDVYVHDMVTGQNVPATQGPGGTPANGPTSDPSVTTAGSDKWAVAATTGATNAQNQQAQPDTNNAADVVLSIEGATPTSVPLTEPISVALGGGMGNAPSAQADVVQGARFVAFASLASNLVVNDTNNTTDVFLRDAQNDTTVRVSVGAGGQQANGPSANPSAGPLFGGGPAGWVVAFESDATNLVTNDLNGSTDIYVRDSNGNLRLVSQALGMPGVPANGTSTSPSVSDDGRFVAFVSTASNLVAGDTNNLPDVFVYDLVTLTLTRQSNGAGGAQPDDLAVSTDVASNGSTPVTAWDSSADNLTPTPDTEDAFDIFLSNGGQPPQQVDPIDLLLRNGFE